jgi:hypothetical protein
MRRAFLLFLFLTFSLLTSARETIRPGEEPGIPERADVEKEMKSNGNKKDRLEKKEVRQNQEKTDPVFYDSTTSPKEMEGHRKDENY